MAGPKRANLVVGRLTDAENRIVSSEDRSRSRAGKRADTELEEGSAMSLGEIKELMEAVARTGLKAVEIDRAGFRVRIEGRSAGEAPAAIPVSPAMAPAPMVVVPMSSTATAPALEPAAEEIGHIVKSPIVGTFYRSPSPDKEAFVKIGDRVEKGQTLCIVEAMKLMNEIESDAAGEVVQIFAQNAQPVEYGERLFAIRPN